MVHRAGNTDVVVLRLFEVLVFLSLPRILACYVPGSKIALRLGRERDFLFIYFRDFPPI